MFSLSFTWDLILRTSEHEYCVVEDRDNYESAEAHKVGTNPDWVPQRAFELQTALIASKEVCMVISE